MRALFLTTLVTLTLFSSTLDDKKERYSASEVPKNMTVEVKKERFFSLLVPAVNRVYSGLMAQYLSVKSDMQKGLGAKRIEELKIKYKAKTDLELLVALKPHPKSLALAQAAMESNWGTSRFFVQANNVFGMWSVNKNDKRIAASFRRDGTKTIWLKKFDSLEDSVKAYYLLMSKGRAYKRFRAVRYESNDVFKMVKKLDKYSELGAVYGERLSGIIRYNKLTKYD